jgi:cell division protein FtsI (penicillin-binding protein 3)
MSKRTAPNSAGRRYEQMDAFPNATAAANKVQARTQERARRPPFDPRRRLNWVLLALCLCTTALLGRALDVQIVRAAFYQKQGDMRHLRAVPIPAYRGAILDRNGEPLAISTPVTSIWANPGELLAANADLRALAKLLDLKLDFLQQRLTQFSDREFVYLRRHLNPELALKVQALDLPGVYSQREFRRFYPTGEVSAHLLGFTSIDDQGQEGAELAFDHWLRGSVGSRRVMQDRKGQHIADVALIKAAEPGQDLRLSIDRRIQYLAYRELKSAVLQHKASSGSLVMIDVPTGEILAMVNQPSYNPNLRERSGGANMRNRAATDVFEPGSVMKSLTIAAAMESGKFTARSLIDTNIPAAAAKHVRDTRNYGVLDLTGIMMHSSSIGVAKLAGELSSDQLYDMFQRFGFGATTGSGFPGESPGYLNDAKRWRDVEKATLSYGYGMSATPLQIARAYATLANGGRMRKPTMTFNGDNPDEAVIDPALAQEINAMLETVVTKHGTAQLAQIANFRVAGKTGTVRKASAQGYQARYIGLFAGFAPASAPRVACVVVINDPLGGSYYGGLVAAPVFSKVVGGALRLLNVTPDAPYSPGVIAKITPEMLDAAAESVAEPMLR